MAERIAARDATGKCPHRLKHKSIPFVDAVPHPQFAGVRWLLAPFFASGDVGDIVPVQCMSRPAPVFNHLVLPLF